MKYVTASEMKAIDKDAVEKRGIPAALLMENAGRAVAEEACKTVTLGLPKISFQSKEARYYTGELIVADIGLGS